MPLNLRLRAWLLQNRQSVLATAAFAAISVGFWMAWAPLGLIVPGFIVFAGLAYSHLRGFNA